MAVESGDGPAWRRLPLLRPVPIEVSVGLFLFGDSGEVDFEGRSVEGTSDDSLRPERSQFGGNNSPCCQNLGTK